jgi:hypothetical protein
MPQNWQISRRTVLRGIGASLALPALDIMSDTAQAGQKAGPPLRFLTVFQPNGVYPKAWNVTGTGRDFELSEILSPLAPVKDDIVVVSHLDNVATQGHVQMTGSFLTGVGMKGTVNARSLDQVYARKVGAQTRFPSVTLGTEPPRQGAAGQNPISFANTISWASPTTRISPEINPRVAFDRLFRQSNGPAARQRDLDRKSVVDLVLAEARSLRVRASSLDRHKIDEYLTSVRSVEERIERNLNPPERSWVPPTEPELERPAAGIPRRRDEHLQLMMDLMVLSMQTDTTRVGTLMTAHGFSRQSFNFLDGVTSDHHGMSHHKDQESAVAEYRKVSRWYIEMFSGMLQKMKSIDEGAGSLLDNTIVMYGSGMKDGNGHRKENLPILLAGSGQGRLETGRQFSCKEHTPLANLHLTLAQKLGLELDEFNGVSTGTIAGL